MDYNTGKIKWQVKTPQPMIGGILATSGGLVFTGEGNGMFKAYDAETGTVLWKFQAGAGVNAPPSSYTVDGKQYIVVAAGGNTQLDYKRGNTLIAFSLDRLKENRELDEGRDGARSSRPSLLSRV